MPGETAFGTKLIGLGGTIANIVSISPPQLSRDTADVTSHDSATGWEEVVPTVKRTGQVTLEINYDPSGTTHNASAGLISALQSGTAASWQIVFPDTGTTTWSFTGYVTGFSPSAPHDGKLSASVTIKPSGAPTLA